MHRNRLRVVAGLALAAVLAIAGYASSAATAAAEKPRQSSTAAPTQKQIAGLFDEWNRALATQDPEQVADRYAPDAVLLPTMSNQVRTDRAGIVDYFEHFLEGKPSGTILESHVKVLGRNAAIDTGTYRFTLTTDGVQKTVDARYTFVYEKVDGEWLIVNHHSSGMPESS